MKKFHKLTIAFVVIAGLGTIAVLLERPSAIKVREELIPLDQAPITSETIELNSEQKLIQSSLRAKNEQFLEEVDKARQVSLEQIQRCVALAVESENLEMAGQEPALSREMALIKSLNQIASSKSLSTLPDIPACKNFAKNLEIVIAIASFSEGEELDKKFAIQQLNIPRSNLLDPIGGDVFSVQLGNIKASFEPLSRERQKWINSFRDSSSGE
jgi:hypothetical protein